MCGEPTVPAPGEPGNDTWSGDSWKRGGSGVWVTGRIRSGTEFVFYGTGNPGPDYHSDSRLGDNLYSDSVIALDADTGKIRWFYQFTPHDVHDWDSTEVPILADIPIAGQMRKVLMFANRNGFYYTLDRTTGKLITAKPFVTTTWAKEFDSNGRPILLPGHQPDEKGTTTCPDITGGTNFWPPSYDPSTQTFFVNAREVCATYFAWKPEYQQGERFTGGAAQRVNDPDSPVYGALRAIDPATGQMKWEFKYLNLSTSGLLTTASGLIFTGDGDGSILALTRAKERANCSGDIRWARPCTERPQRPTCSMGASTCGPGRHHADRVGLASVAAGVLDSVALSVAGRSEIVRR